MDLLYVGTAKKFEYDYLSPISPRNPKKIVVDPTFTTLSTTEWI